MAKNDRLTAAGGVLWRERGDVVEVLLVHRPGYDDWSLPKGKPDDGENPLQTAIREVGEETGLPFTVGPRLGHVSYQVKGRPKTVWYWSMRLDPGCTDDPSAMDDDEVDEFAWVPATQAAQALTYRGDRHILASFTRTGTVPVSLILVRHGRAGNREQWSGPDDLRPLDNKGRRQADMLGRTLTAFAPTRLLSAPPARCRQTAEPVSMAGRLPIEVVPEISDRAWEAQPDLAIAAIADLAATGQRIVAVSQGKVMRAALGALLPPRKSDQPARKGGMWVLGARDGRIVTHDYYASVLPL